MSRFGRWPRAAAWSGVGAVGLLLILSTESVARKATAWLYDWDPPAPSDLLVVLGGGSKERLTTVIELYRAGLAPAILITDGAGFPDEEMSYLEKQGVPARSLIPPLRPATSTYEDALSIKQVVVRKKFKSVLVVTSPYHCRRARMILERVVGSAGVRVAVTPSISLYMDKEHWWRSHQGWITVSGEFPKLLWAWATVPTVTTVGDAGRPK